MSFPWISCQLFLINKSALQRLVVSAQKLTFMNFALFDDISISIVFKYGELVKLDLGDARGLAFLWEINIFVLKQQAKK